MWVAPVQACPYFPSTQSQPFLVMWPVAQPKMAMVTIFVVYFTQLRVEVTCPCNLVTKVFVKVTMSFLLYYNFPFFYYLPLLLPPALLHSKHFIIPVSMSQTFQHFRKWPFHGHWPLWFDQFPNGHAAVLKVVTHTRGSKNELGVSEEDSVHGIVMRMLAFYGFLHNYRILLYVFLFYLCPVLFLATACQMRRTCMRTCREFQALD